MTHKIYEAALDETGQIVLMEPVACSRLTRALVIVLEGEEPSSGLTPGKTVSGSDQQTAQPTADSVGTSAGWTSRYRPVRPLGQGGMGRVLLAKRISDGALVCLKFLRDAANPRVFEQECRALIRLRHPAIVGLLDFSASENPPWLAMEYAMGCTLSDYLKEHGALPTKAVLGLLTALVKGLAYAHSQGVIHRDLKPSNVIVEQDPPGVRILDFGLALVDRYDLDGNLTASGAIPAGTLLYMAPEQLNSELLSPACDIYAMGLIACEMLTGKPPFDSTDLRKVIVEKMRLSSSEMDQLPATVPPGLSKLIGTCTQREPSKRPSASQALEVLHHLTD